MKLCTSCGKPGPFYKDKYSKDGFRTTCKSCMVAVTNRSRKPLEYKPMTVELWENQWVVHEVMAVIVYGFLRLNDDRVFSRAFWRVPGERPFANCHASHRALSRKNGGVGRRNAKQSTIAGPFTKEELWMATKMIEKNPLWKIEKKATAWWVVPKK